LGAVNVGRLGGAVNPSQLARDRGKMTTLTALLALKKGVTPEFAENQ
jgi:hypothetical protein